MTKRIHVVARYLERVSPHKHLRTPLALHGVQVEGTALRVQEFALRPLSGLLGLYKFSREFVGSWRASGIKVLPYMDDFLFAGSPRYAGSTTDFSSMRATRDRVLADLESGGLLVNREKPMLDFTQSIDHLGVGIDTVKGVIFTTPNRWDRFQATLTSAMTRSRRHVPVKVFASVAGQAVSLSVCLGPVSRMFTRSLYVHT